MAYPNNIDVFSTKLNKLENNIYTIEEQVNLTEGVYEGELEHDNINENSLAVYTGSKLTGIKINNYILSTPSQTPWKKIIKIFSDVSPVYITYQTQGDTVEADDINKVQDSIVNTQTALNSEISRAQTSENNITDNLTSEINRAKGSENTLTNNLNSEIDRAKDSENTLTDNLGSEITRAQGAEADLSSSLNSEETRAKGAEGTLTTNLGTTNTNLNNEISRATNKEDTLNSNLNLEASRAQGAESTLTTNLNSEISRAKSAENDINNTINTNKPVWDDKYTRNEVDNKLSALVTGLDYKEHVATFADLATTYPNAQDGWTVSVDADNITYKYNGTSWIPISSNSIPLATESVSGLMSSQDKTDHDDMVTKRHTHSNLSLLETITQVLVSNWNSAYTHISDAVKHITSTERTNWNDAFSKEHIHSNLSLLETLTQTLINNWNAAYTHITDTVKHITSAERTLWNTVSNKVDKISGMSLSTNDFSNTYKTKVDGISTGANKTTSSATNGNIEIDGTETTVYTHPGSGTNPHGTTKSDVGLGNVTNDAQVKRAEMGTAGGVSTLDSSGINAQTPKAHTHDDRYYTESESDTKYATKSEIAQAGYGDMLKSVYDTNDNGVVDEAETALKLTSARTISLIGDSTGSTSFDGSSDANITLTLAGSGVTAGTYKSVTVDSKGRVTAGTNPTTLAGYGITDALSFTGNAVSASKLATGRTITLAGDVTGSTTFDGSANVSVSATLTASSVLTKLKTVDGAGSGLDADTLDGKDSSAFAPSGFGLGGISTRLSSPDLNSIINNGWYDCQTPTNYVPDIGSNWHKLLVIASADTNYVTQIAFSMVNQTSGSAWIREKRAGTWGSWTRILTSSKQCTWNDLKGV